MKRDRIIKLILTVILAIVFTQLLGYFFLYVGYIMSDFYIIQNYIVIAIPILTIILIVIKKVKLDIMLIPIAIVTTFIGPLSGGIITEDLQALLIYYAWYLIFNLAFLTLTYLMSETIFKKLPKYLENN